VKLINFFSNFSNKNIECFNLKLFLLNEKFNSISFKFLFVFIIGIVILTSLLLLIYILFSSKKVNVGIIKLALYKIFEPCVLNQYKLCRLFNNIKIF